MASNTDDDVRTTRSPRRVLWWTLAAGPALSGALLFAAAEASAQEITGPGLGAVEIPAEIASPPGLSGIVTVPSDLAPISDPTPAQFSIAGVEFALPDIAGFDYSTLPGFSGLERPNPVQPRVAPGKTAGEVAIEAARGKLGSGYSANSAGPDAFDCSGLVQWSYQQAGVSLPRTSYDQLATGTPVSERDLRPGDLVSFYGGGHSGLYAGDGKVIHASTYGTGVTVSPMSSMPFAGARRFQD